MSVEEGEIEGAFKDDLSLSDLHFAHLGRRLELERPSDFGGSLGQRDGPFHDGLSGIFRLDPLQRQSFVNEVKAHPPSPPFSWLVRLDGAAVGSICGGRAE